MTGQHSTDTEVRLDVLGPLRIVRPSNVKAGEELTL
jgi:hypothetical protein